MPMDLPPETRRLGEDWVETAELRPSGPDDVVDLVGLVVSAELRDAYRPEAEPALQGSTAGAFVIFGDRTADGRVPVIVRAPAALVFERLAEGDYRFDLIAARDGLTLTWASGLRRFRS